MDILFSFGPRISQIPPYDTALTPPPAKGEIRRGWMSAAKIPYLPRFPSKLPTSYFAGSEIVN